MSRTSAGVLLYRVRDGALQVLLVHPGGPFWAKKDLGAWSVPKGVVREDEAPLDAARREFQEETGTRPDGDFVALSPVRQKGGKTVHAWAVAGDLDPDGIRSNTFELEWPPRSGRTQAFPEVDRAGWFPLREARKRILASQTPLLDELARLVSDAGT
ncbi:MAG: NUDIX domain-containing protein [Gemmatimonadota bacterium]